MSGVITQQLLQTPRGLLRLSEVFGIEGTEGDDSDDQSCVACLSEPRDTILLPCRHLCVCSRCFDHLHADRCPVCRAHFSSYVRIAAVAAQAAASDGAAPDEQSASSAAAAHCG